jgi:transglutaminase-like putative cysteine protease
MKKLILVLCALGACSTGREPAPSGNPDPAPSGNQQTLATSYMKPAGSRTFTVEYVAKISDVPAGTRRLRVWLPVPQDSTVQTISGLAFSMEPRITIEPKYGNKIATWEIENPGAALDITMRFTCRRDEVRMDLDALREDGAGDGSALDVFRGPDTLVTVDDEIRALSKTIVKERRSTLDRAYAIYQYVLDRMAYDKNHLGWGRGSTKHACEVGKGNCTDFHALFNSLCRAQGIASGFEIGLYLPYENKTKGEKLGGYHCWAFFRVPGKSWVPVDCSEADRFPERAAYFFGSHTSNRVTLSTGRDLVLEPKQAGEPLNYFLNPYAEADGKAVKTDKVWAFKDVD